MGTRVSGKIYARQLLNGFTTLGLVLLLIAHAPQPTCGAETTTTTADVPLRVDRPNIIFILTDDQRWDSLGIMGNPIIKTPNVDRLGSQGIVFLNGYVTTSICAISRASILTGQYESRHGINNFSKSLTPEQVAGTYPSLLRKSGYKTGFVGKYGVGKDQPSGSFDFWECTKKTQPDYLTKDKQGREIHDTDKVTSSALKFLQKFGRQGPFCLSVSYKAPHELDGHPPKYVVQDRFRHLYKKDHIPLPVTYAPQYWSRLPEFFHTDENIARQRWRDLYSTPQLFQENVKNYYRLITGVDDGVGKLVRKLRDSGLDKNTVIIYMGDNGFSLGEHGLEGKWFGFEESIRVPLIISYPGLPDSMRQTRPAQIALNIDIAPTILALAGVDKPRTMQGENLLDFLSGKLPQRKDFFYEHTFLKSPKLPQVEGVVGTQWKYMKYIEHGYEQLFDTMHDPHETVNLALDPAYEKQLKVMRQHYQMLKKGAR